MRYCQGRGSFAIIHPGATLTATAAVAATASDSDGDGEGNRNSDGDREFDGDALDAFAASGDGDAALVRRVLAAFMQTEEPGMRSGLPSSEKRGGWVHDFSLGVSPGEIVRNPGARVERWRARIARMHDEIEENDGDIPHWWGDWYDDEKPTGEEGDLDGPIEALVRSVEKVMSDS